MTSLVDLAWSLGRALPAETAHRAAVRALAFGLGRRAAPDPPALATRVLGLDLPNPIGLAAGFDKSAEAFEGALALGFGFVEVGTVTPRPQAGNPRPRLFRLPEDRAVINRMGFNNDGLDAVAARLARRTGSGVVGANVGANKDSADRIADYALGVARLHGLADYITVNVSSPNTPGLRDLQQAERFAPLIDAVAAARAKAAGPARPILVKIAPDLEPDEAAALAELALGHGIDGLIIGNTTVTRPPSLRSAKRHEAGGLSGRPLLEPSTRLLAAVHHHVGGRLVLIGVGGVASAEDVNAKLRAGASLVQLYTALVYDGPRLVERLKRDLARLMEVRGVTVGRGT
ncbi:MAG: quinone-dependent dihydroorotate dehydrogenase [Alphaproteobacteria bacterium]